MLILQAENNTLIEIEAFLKKCWEEDVFDAFRSKNEPFFSRFISGDAIKKRMYTGSIFYYFLLENDLKGVAEVQDGKHIALFFIASDLRGKGVGKRFIEKLEHVLIKNKHQLILTVHAYLPHAGFYRSCGYAESGAKVLGMETFILPMYKRIVD